MICQWRNKLNCENPFVQSFKKNRNIEVLLTTRLRDAKSLL